MRVIELINELQKYPIDAFINMTISEMQKSNCPGYTTCICAESEIENIYYNKEKNILTLMGETTDTFYL